MNSICEFGARANTDVTQTAAIQAAIDACGAAGGGEVFIPPGVYLTGTLALCSHVTLRLANGARLLGSTNYADYRSDLDGFNDAIGQQRGRCVIYAEGARSVAICGDGVIDGQGGRFPRGHDGRPFLIRFVRCRDVRIEGVRLKNAAAWVSHYLDCERVHIHGVTIRSRANENNDGIDIDSCRGVRITACDIDTDDDAICLKSTLGRPCENIVVTGCLLKSSWGALKIGTESIGDIRNVDISHCIIRETLGGGLKIISMDGSRIENINASDLVMDQVCGPIFLRLGARLRTYYEDQTPRPAGSMRNISIRNITGRVVEDAPPLYGHPRRAGIFVSGIRGHRIERVRFENVSLTFPGGGTPDEAARRHVPERVADYPEFPFFAPLPSWGFYLRHATDVRLRDVRIETETVDARLPLVTEEVDGLETEDTRIANPASQPSVALDLMEVFHRMNGLSRDQGPTPEKMISDNL